MNYEDVENFSDRVRKILARGKWPSDLTFNLDKDTLDLDKETCIEVSLDKMLTADNCRKLDAWAMAFVAEVEKEFGDLLKPFHVTLLLKEGYGDNKTYFEALRRRVSFLDVVKNGLSLSLHVVDRIELDTLPKLLKPGDDEVLRDHKDYKKRTAEDKL